MSADADTDGFDGDDDSHANDSDGDPVSDGRTRFSTPPRTVTDGVGRTIRLRVAADTDDATDADNAADTDHAALAAMYDDFGVGDRAQGIPPADPDRRSEWLDRIGAGLDVLAEHDDRVVGHGVLLAGGPGHELALFVHPDYRGAGVGTALLDGLLDHGRSAGVERVWLSVQRSNRPAIRLYRNAGFSPTESGAGEVEMRRTLR